VTFEVAGDRNMRRGLAAGGQMAYTQAARGTQYLNIGNGLRVAGAVIGIIDGFMALAEAESMARRGELRSRVRTQAFLGGLGIGGGLLALAASSLVLIPFIIGVVMLIGAYLLVKLVPNNIATWLRRSLYGKEQGTFRFQPFQSMQEEQESLKMVFSGIEFDMDVVRAIDSWGGTLMPPNWRDDVKSGGSKKFNLTVTIKFPKGLEGQLKVLMKCYPSEGEERYLGGATYTKNSLVSVDRYGQVIGNSQARDVFEDEPDLSKKSGFDLKQGDDLNTLCYEMDLDMTTGLLESNLIYIGQSGSASQVKYPMELSV
jgi:F0F1-type ATP synthase membrane subunit c/vacuolar-type H+-ATPase subunit K